jgi:UDP-2,4-diacetamido-2,4,6-trideoxy-beta-L-altropyranose hydrolase
MDASDLESDLMNRRNHLSKECLNFVFRLDAGRHFGNGHFMRSLVLCTELLDRGHTVAVLAQQVPLPLQAVLRERGIALHLIAPQSDGLTELASVNKIHPVDWLVIDHYGIDAGWESAARPFTAHTMVIDDLANRPHNCDLLLDQNVPNRLQQLYSDLLPQHCVKAIGWSHLLARPEFYVRVVQERSGILVFLGGGDHSEVLSPLIGKLLKRTNVYPLKVLVSSDYLPVAHWQTILSHDGQLHCDLPNPLHLYRSVKLAVVRCGFVSYELALLGIPAVHIYASPVQAEVAHALESMGAGVALSEDHLSDALKLYDAIERAAALDPQPLNEKLTPGATQVANLLEHFYEHR